MEEEGRQDLKLIVKSDVIGTGDAVIEALGRLPSDKIRLDVIHVGVGAVSESDVLLASASDAIIVGFRVQVNAAVNALAKRENVEIRLFSVIYELIEQIREAMEGMIEPEIREESLGQAEILQVFNISKTGKICGCAVGKGMIRSGAKARGFRDDDLIFNGGIVSLRRFQDDVKEVRMGLECGIKLDNFSDFEVGDVIDVYEYKEVAVKL